MWWRLRWPHRARQNVFYECGLPSARFARDEDDPAGLGEMGTQRGALTLAADQQRAHVLRISCRPIPPVRRHLGACQHILGTMTGDAVPGHRFAEHWDLGAAAGDRERA